MDTDFGPRLEEGGTAVSSSAHIEAIRETVRSHYREHRRDLPWRRTSDPYEILVSELMLRQTHLVRVLPKYEQFLAASPTVPGL
jgi:A/G-specific adenine glycosylase